MANWATACRVLIDNISERLDALQQAVAPEPLWMYPRSGVQESCFFRSQPLNFLKIEPWDPIKNMFLATQPMGEIWLTGFLLSGLGVPNPEYGGAQHFCENVLLNRLPSLLKCGFLEAVRCGQDTGALLKRCFLFAEGVDVLY